MIKSNARTILFTQALFEAEKHGITSCRQLALFMLCVESEGKTLREMVDKHLNIEAYSVYYVSVRQLMDGEKHRGYNSSKLLRWAEGIGSGIHAKTLHTTHKGRKAYMEISKYL